MTTIEWTQATWNPIVGCSVISPGCTNCYAMRTAARLSKNPATPHYAGTVKPSKVGPVWTGKLALAPERALTAPLRRRKPHTYFVNSMGDLFHDDVPDDWIDRVFAVMALAPQHTFQVLTKRADRMRAYFAGDADDGFMPAEARIEHRAKQIARERGASIPIGKTLVGTMPWPHVWLGVSAEDQARADARIPDLLATPAAVRFVSAEPLLGPVRMDAIAGDNGTWIDALDGAQYGDKHGPGNVFVLAAPGTLHRLDWVITGGESGPSARPMHPDWARSLRDQCQAAGVPFFFKQHGKWLHESQDPHAVLDWGDADDRNILHHWHDDPEMVTCSMPLPKKAAGRLLDGREWNEMPGRVTNA